MGFIVRGQQTNKFANMPDQCFLIGRPDLGKSPKFRCKLMGFPEDWLDVAMQLKPRETRSCRKSRT